MCSIVDPEWTMYDVSVAMWLLDPDKQVSNFEQMLSSLDLPQQVCIHILSTIKTTIEDNLVSTKTEI